MSESITKLDAMTREERSLLLYLETQAVDHGGIVNTACMNAADMAIAKRWFKEGFIGFARLLSKHLKIEPRPEARNQSHVVQLLPLAFECAGIERMRRAVRTIKPVVVESLQHRGCMASELCEEMVPSGIVAPA